jgi:hypothetical protein
LQNSGLPTSRAGTVHCCENRIWININNGANER